MASLLPKEQVDSSDVNPSEYGLAILKGKGINIMI